MDSLLLGLSLVFMKFWRSVWHAGPVSLGLCFVCCLVLSRRAQRGGDLGFEDVRELREASTFSPEELRDVEKVEEFRV